MSKLQLLQEGDDGIGDVYIHDRVPHRAACARDGQIQIYPSYSTDSVCLTVWNENHPRAALQTSKFGETRPLLPGTVMKIQGSDAVVNKLEKIYKLERG